MKHELKQDDWGDWTATHEGPNTEPLTESAETDLGASILAALGAGEADELTQEEADLIVSELMKLRTCGNCKHDGCMLCILIKGYEQKINIPLKHDIGCNAWERKT